MFGKKFTSRKMSYTLKRIVCLAKSRKSGGLCFAGKEILTNGSIGGWIRPVSSRNTEEISNSDCQYENGRQPHFLDIIEIPLKKYHPQSFQFENYLIDDGYYWEKKGVFNFQELNSLCDNPTSLWSPHGSSYYGIKDRVDEYFSNELDDSLYFINPDNLTIIVQVEGAEFHNPIRKVRARFEYNDVTYLFPVTDPIVENQYLQKEDGHYPFRHTKNRVFICVSIGLPFNGYCYKFVASILENE